ncbi:MAG: glycosyltransferase family A protein [Methyloprofundus sp.]|nr:glycosyltransferase family A protein [Methyloprofundus sp.]
MIFKITIIIPTHNRPELLNEALDSIAMQNHSEDYELEVVIIDDASTPPVQAKALNFKLPITLHRNNTAQGLAYNRDKGVQLASTDYITHLDDDDKLAPDALDNITLFFKQHPDTQILFLGVEGFGRSDYFQKVQSKALTKIIATCPDVEAINNTFFFKPSLFTALLKTVPMCFQREVTTKAAWLKTNNLRLTAYFGDYDSSKRDHYMQQISGPLRDSEWALYASLTSDSALLNQPIYLQRCEGQGMVSQLAMRDKQVNAQIDTKKQLCNASKTLVLLKHYQSQIKDNLETTYFDNAYYQLHTQRNKTQAWHFLLQAFTTHRRLKHLAFFIKLLLPKALIKSPVE